MTTLPTCTCGSNNFEAGGGTFSFYSTQHYTCESCGKFGMVFTYNGGSYFFLFTEDEADSVNSYLNTKLMPMLRARWERVEAERKEAWKEQEVIIRHLIPDFLSHRATGEGRKYDALTEEEKKTVRDVSEGFDRSFRPSAALIAALYPPQVPSEFPVYWWNPNGSSGDMLWERVDPTESAAVPVPRDPILVRNEEFFADVWTEVERNIEQPLPTCTEVKNEYGGIEPWYAFTLNGVRFTMGWRKRVVSITAETEQGTLPTTHIRTVAQADGVTYEAHSAPRDYTVEEMLDADGLTGEKREATREVLLSHVADENGLIRNYSMGGWQSDMPNAVKILVHAWSKDKTIQYLTILARTALRRDG